MHPRSLPAFVIAQHQIIAFAAFARQVCEAILGCSRSVWHMGQNDRHRKFNGLDLILRDAEHIDMFVELASKRVTGPESIEERNARILAELVAQDSTADPDVIDVDMTEVDHA